VQVATVPRWEAELWSYISRGDGVHCPLYSLCQVRQRGGWCPSDCAEHLTQAVDINYGATVTPGRMFTLVEMLARKYLKKGKACCPPVPTDLVAFADEQYPIEVRLVPLAAYHGAIWYLDDSWVIQLNKNDTLATRRFTLFHEAFHILAHRSGTPVFRKIGLEAGSFNELLAEQFAACTLMPDRWVRENWVEVNDLTSLAEIFAVPESAVYFRLKFLHLI